MTDRLRFERLLQLLQLLLLWIHCLLLFTAAEGDPPCPRGGRIHLSSLRCYWIPEQKSSWSEAQHSCRGTPGGDLASAESLELQTFIHDSFPVKTTVWMWLKRFGGEGSEQVLNEGCCQMALGGTGQWRREKCSGQHVYLCETDVSEALPPADCYQTGLVLLSGVYDQTQVQPLLSVPEIGPHTVEMQLFPGLWFSHAGQLVKVQLVVLPTPQLSLARVQILRPYCDPNHYLVPPGCSSLLNPFSCCSPVPLCNTTGGCSVGQYWCHLLEVCVPVTRPCSPYDPAAKQRGFALPPRYTAIPPFYHIVADLSLRISPSSKLKTLSVDLPDAGIMVYPDDIIAIQHTRDSGTFLHCLNSEASSNSSWRQSYLSLQGSEWEGWWQGGLTPSSQKDQWVDGVVCDLSILYVDTLGRGTELDGLFGFTHTEETTAPDVRPLATSLPPDSRSKLDLSLIHPLLDKYNRIHVLINVPTLIVVKLRSGQKARSFWSGPVLQTDVPFLPSCPEELAFSWSGCSKQSSDEWFSTTTLMLPVVGVQTLNIRVEDAVNPEINESLRVEVHGYKAVTGLRVEPPGCLRMLVDMSQLLTATVEAGSSVKFTWVIDDLEKFSYEGESYSVAFKNPAEYKVTVTASNPVSSQTQQIVLVADHMTPLAEAEFLSPQEVVAVNATHVYTVRVKVDVSLPVTFRWYFGDGSNRIEHPHSAPCQITEGLVQRGVKQLYVQDSVNYTYTKPGDFKLQVQISNQHESIDASMKIDVHPLLGPVHISCAPPAPLVNRSLFLDANVEPSVDNVVYSWDFGDGSKSVQGINHRVSHTFGSVGLYNVTVCVNNTLATVATWIMLEVMEKISGLSLSCSGSAEVNSAVVFSAQVATGSSLIWNYDFGDESLLGNLTDNSISHGYKAPGNYTVVVTVSNVVSKVQESIKVEIYSLAVKGILPMECVMNGRDVELTAIVTGNISLLTFHWQFGDGSPLTVVTGKSQTIHYFPNPGIFHLNVTVFSSASSAPFTTSICVEAPITNVTVQASSDVAAVGEEVCFKVSVSPEQVTGYQFRWLNSSLRVGALTGNSEQCLVFKDEGVEEISVVAWNQVSDRTSKFSITIQKPVSQLSVVHDSQGNSLMANTPVSFWTIHCSGSNVSVLWDFGDGSPSEQRENVSHVFTSTGQFTVTATASNLVSRASATITVSVVLPVSDLSLHTNQSYAAVGEEIIIRAVCSVSSSTTYYWTVEGLTTTHQGGHQFRCSFPVPGVFQVKVVAQNLIGTTEATVFIQVLERIQGLQIMCDTLTNKKYVPTKEEQQFAALVSKGSNVTFQWLVTQSGRIREMTGQGEQFKLSVDNPGEVSVRLKAHNKLGEASNDVLLMAVERVSSVRITATSAVVALGKPVNISVAVVGGSDLQYLWFVSYDQLPLKTLAPWLLYNFTSLGSRPVTVVVQNVLGESNDTKEFMVQEEVGEVDFKINGKLHPFYIDTYAAVLLHGVVHTGSDLHWHWAIRNTKDNILNATNQTFIYKFSRADTYQVTLNVSNEINWKMVSHKVTVQDGITGLELHISRNSLCHGEDVSFIPSVSTGSDVNFVLALQNKDWIHHEDIVQSQYTTSSLPAGRSLVTLQARNLVSRAEVSSSLVVAENIHGVQLVGCCPAAVEVLKEHSFRAMVPGGSLVNYSWTFDLNGQEQVLLSGQEVTFTPAESGSLSVSMEASNGGCFHVLTEKILVEWPVRNISLHCHSESAYVGHAVRFSATVEGGGNTSYTWDFGDSSERLTTDSTVVSHVYYSAGKYNVSLQVYNSVSNMSSQIDVEVEELQCSSPEVSLGQRRFMIYRSRSNLIEVDVDNNCSAYKTMYRWEIFTGSDCTRRNRMTWSSPVDKASPVLFLPQRTLDVGQHCLLLTVSFQGTPLVIQQTANLTVLHSPLVPVIKGGSHKQWSSLTDLILDGSESEDPDMELGAEDMLQYHWTSINVNSTNFEEQPTGSNSSRATVLNNQLHPGTVYIFTLTVYKPGREPASVNQTVTVCEAPVLPVTVRCVSCSAHSSRYTSGSTDLILAGQCEQCDDQTLYKWNVEVQNGMTFDLDDITTTTGSHSPNLVVRSGVLQPGLSYIFTLDVTHSGGGQRGSAGQTVILSNPPRGGLCDLSPESDIDLLETVVTYNCSGWKDDEGEASQLIFTFQVVRCQSISPECLKLVLYRGTRSSFGSLLPLGRPVQDKNQSVITVTLIIEDQLGSKTVALNRSLTVQTPIRQEVSTQWLRNKSQTQLLVLVQHNNPQEIVPYCMALTSHLNQMGSGRSAAELMDMREIRRNVSDALASLPVSSLLDVDQISSALALSTVSPHQVAPGALGCGECHAKILDAVKRMVGVMDDQISPGVSSAPETGGNILNILGSTLAAVSDSESAANTISGPSSSTIAMTTFNLTGALARSLMHSRVPLLVSSPFLSTLGFQGDPTDLLCSGSSHRLPQNQMVSSGGPCQFHIPTSLSAQLKSQRSEVVQVLFSMDGGLKSNVVLGAADPPISTSIVGMELSTPQGQLIPIRDLDPEQAIQVTLPNRYIVEQGHGSEDGTEEKEGNGTCLTVTLSTQREMNFTVNSVEGLDRSAGLYISFNFSLASEAASVTWVHVKVAVESLAVLKANTSENVLEEEWTVALSGQNISVEKSILLPTLLRGSDHRLLVTLISSVTEGLPVQVSICLFSSLCQYYDVEKRTWSSDGLQPLEGSTLQAARCLTQHLTIFGASLFVHPGAVVLLPPSEGPVRNIMVGIVCAVLLLAHLLVGLIAHKVDHIDSVRLSQVPLCGRPGLYHYRVLVKTGWRGGAGTTAHVGISLYGVSKSGVHHLQRDGAFQRGSLDQFHLETEDNLGEIWKIRIWHDNTGLNPSWFVQHVVVWDTQTDHMFFFVLEDWLSVENYKNETVEKEVLASCPEEMTEFQRVFTSQLMFGLRERHLWVSLWERPAHSRFTRGQRVTCSALVLHLYLAVGAVWFGAVGSEGDSGPVSAKTLLNAETVAVGVTMAALVFPLQSLLCFLFRKTHSQVTVDVSVPPSPVCQSVEMDVYLGQSGLSSSSLLSLPNITSPARESPSSLLESKVCDSSILDFWTASGLMPQTDQAGPENHDVIVWPSCDSLLSLPVDSCPTRTDLGNVLPTMSHTRQLRRKKALTQLRLSSPSVPVTHPQMLLPTPCRPHDDHEAAAPGQRKVNVNTHSAKSHNLTTFLTLSEEDLLMSIAASAEDTTRPNNNSNSDSGRDSPRTMSSFSATQSTSCSSWSDHSDDKSLCGTDLQMSPTPDGPGLYKCPSVLSVDSVASTFLPSPSPDSTHSYSTTRIGVSRGPPSWFLPPWTLHVIYPLVVLLLGTCLAVVGLYGSFFSRAVVLMWLVSALSAFLTSALLLEPLKVCVQALIFTLLWRPVDPEVENLLAQETTVVRGFGDHSAKVRPPCGYGLLQAKDEARKVRALKSLMKNCLCQLLFLWLVLMVNYQDSVEQRQGRLLQSTVRHHLHTTPSGVCNLTSIRDWSEAEEWIGHTLVPHLHQNPSLHLVGSTQLQFTNTFGHQTKVLLGNDSVTTLHLLADLHMTDWSQRLIQSVTIDWTQYHRESGLFVCVSVLLEWAHREKITPQLTIHPLLIPASSSGLDLHVALTVLLLLSALLIFFTELWSKATEQSPNHHQLRHWLQLFIALLSLVTAMLQFCFLSAASSCVSQLRSQPHNFINFHRAALLAQRSSQCAAVLLTLLVLKLLGTLGFVRRWLVIGRVLQRARGELWALTALLLLLVLLSTHLGNTLFSDSVEGFLSVHEAAVSSLSILRGQMVLQRLCKVQKVLGPLYGLLLRGGGLWILGRLCGAVLIRAYREEKAELHQPTIEPQDHEMVEFFIKRLKLWMGLTKTKEFRHRVKFEGMDVPPSRTSRESRLSTVSSALSSYSSPSLSSSLLSPRPPSSVLSVRSEDLSECEPGSDAASNLDHLLPSVEALLSCFDRVNRVTEDIHDLEMKLEEVLRRRRCKWVSDQEEGVKPFGEPSVWPRKSDDGTVAETRQRKSRVFHPKPRTSLQSSPPSSSTLHSAAPSVHAAPRTHRSHSESESVLPSVSSDNFTSATKKPLSGFSGLNPGGSPRFAQFPRRRAWHSGCSHSADAAQRVFQASGGVFPYESGGENAAFMNSRPRSEEGVRRIISEGFPVKRKAWISEGD